MSEKFIESNLIIENSLDKTKNSKLFTCCESNNINKKYILKTFNQKNKINNEIFFKILNKFKNINSKNIAKIFGGNFVNKCFYNNNFSIQNCYYIIIEKYFDLSNFITHLNKGFNEEITKFLFIQILNGLKDYNFYDIKVKNIYLNNLLINFNFDNDNNNNNNNNEIININEIYNIDDDDNNNNKNNCNLVLSDVFLENIENQKENNLNRDLALILIELITGKLPENLIKYLNDSSVFWKILKKNYKNLNFSLDLIDLINKLIENDSFNCYINNNNNNNKNLNYYEKIMFHPWFEGLKIKDINDNNNGIYNFIIEEFKERYKEIKNKLNNNNNQLNEINLSLPNVLHRSNSNLKIYFSNETKCVKYQKNDKNFLTSIKLNLKSEFDFMNDLANFCSKKSKCFKVSKKKYYKFKFCYNEEEEEEEENEEDSNINNLYIKIELQKENNNKYQLNIFRLFGDKILFYNFYEKLKQKFFGY